MSRAGSRMKCTSNVGFGVGDCGSAGASSLSPLVCSRHHKELHRSLNIYNYFEISGRLSEILPLLDPLPPASCLKEPYNMSSRMQTGQRPGARFAQFKLVLLGRFSLRYHLCFTLSRSLTAIAGESAVGKVNLRPDPCYGRLSC